MTTNPNDKKRWNKWWKPKAGESTKIKIISPAGATINYQEHYFTETRTLKPEEARLEAEEARLEAEEAEAEEQELKLKLKLKRLEKPDADWNF